MHDHDYPEHHNHEYAQTDEYGYTFAVSTVGGGSVGQSYSDNYWHFRVTDSNDVEMMHGSDLYIPFPTTHYEAADALADFYYSDNN